MYVLLISEYVKMGIPQPCFTQVPLCARDPLNRANTGLEANRGGGCSLYCFPWRLPLFDRCAAIWICIVRKLCSVHLGIENFKTSTTG
jgi:hypothetical protein